MRRIVAIVLALCLMLGLSACGGTSNNTIYIALEDITTLDPQIVSRPADRTVVLNIYEGLLRLDSNDTPIPAAAKEFSKEGLEYTFTLESDLCWSDGTALTAYDFQFAFRRAANPETDAPDFAKISAIKGANAVKNGADVSKLGVKAVDDRTLKITLEREDENFLLTLTEPICMPCNEAFFLEQKGKYGRRGESTLSNGSFYVFSWNSDRIRLKRNGYYSGGFTAKPDEIFLTSPEESEIITMLSDKDIDLSLIDSSKSEAAMDKGLTATSYFDKYVFVVINKNADFGPAAIRKALSLSIHRNALEHELPSYLIPFSALVQPEACFEGTPIYGEVTGFTDFKYLPDEAYDTYLGYTKVNGSPATGVIIYPAELKIDSLVSGIASGWQQSLGCFLNMSALDSNSAVMNKIESGDFTIAVCALSAGDSNAYELLSQFRSGNSFGFSNAEFDSILNSLHAKTTVEEYVAAIRRAQSILLSDNSIIPIVAAPTVVCSTEQIKYVNYSIANEYIDFTTIEKK
ncbi:MAG: peptide ABC transporter substrate-binding protein [Clostridia bacterium]|nr:peptide ABC transporter substrate-binding protein [Clostridia bacterium]